MVNTAAWPVVFDDLIDFRRFIRRQFGVPVRAEVKANYLLRNGGPLRPLGLSEQARFAIYRAHLRLQPKLGLTAFAIVIEKQLCQARRPGADPRDIAWEYLIQRLERFTMSPASVKGPPFRQWHGTGLGALSASAGVMMARGWWGGQVGRVGGGASRTSAICSAREVAAWRRRPMATMTERGPRRILTIHA